MNKQNIRKALKQINKLSEQMSVGMYMDDQMDGSGECGRFIYEGWCSWFNAEVEQVLAETGVTLEQLFRVTDEWAKKELEMGPKQIFINMYGKKKGMYKAVDYLDTKWGSIAFELSQYKYVEQ